MTILLAIVCLALPIIISGSVALFLKINQSNLKLLLALSASYLFSISIMHLLPEVFQTTQNGKQIGLFIVIGFCLQLVIESFSTGIEHGHAHAHNTSCKNHLPHGIIIGLLLHSLLEGLPIYNPLASNQVSPINFQIILGLAMHNIPIAITFVTLLRDHKASRQKNIFLLFLLSAMAPLGLLISYTLHNMGLGSIINFSNIAFAIVIGIFLHISTAIMFETSENHRYTFKKIAVLLVGVSLAFILS